MNKAKPKKGCPTDLVTVDEKSKSQPNPKEATFLWGNVPGSYVTVSYVAKDWGVSNRRIRALLASGRLLGTPSGNGQWQVHFPYAFTFGTRGPSLKRQQRPPKRPKPAPEKPELKAV